ncbi:hypothetical protein SeMB42_g01330 [Synchytrium endobioticum]|uniref:Stress response protein NST1 n=1 Tax=Synchytrium endobioticum TaxID=286115 RepID=A0A507DBZ6_9FUNG|nr:hypothetical protein SeLEV6574_g01611 [Synchytrium endobioticum]TPX52576.1 hypothetical protein SeMB42_g01330 [Synchytrium endobioticum]
MSGSKTAINAPNAPAVAALPLSDDEEDAYSQSDDADMDDRKSRPILQAKGRRPLPATPAGRNSVSLYNHGSNNPTNRRLESPSTSNQRGTSSGAPASVADSEDFADVHAPATSSKKKKKKKASKKTSSHIAANARAIASLTGPDRQRALSTGPTTSPHTTTTNHHHHHHHSSKPSDVWYKSDAEEKLRIREFWLDLTEDERRALVKLEKEAVLKKMKEQQKQTCSCSVCGRKRTVIEEELEILYDAYYEELENFTHDQARNNGRKAVPHPHTHTHQHHHNLHHHHHHHHHASRRHSRSGSASRDSYNEESEEDDEEEEDDEYEESDGSGSGIFEFGNSLTVKDGNILTVADDFLKNDGRKFLELMEQLAERKMKRLDEDDMSQGNGEWDDSYEDEDDEYEDDEEEDTMTEEQRMEEGRRMFQIFAAKMFEQRVLQAYREKVARERQQRFLEELEEEERQKELQAEQRQRNKEKKKLLKKAQKQQRDEERLQREREKAAEEEKARQDRERAAEIERQRKEAEKHKREEDRIRKETEERQRQAAATAKKEEEKRKRREEEEKRRKEKEERDRVEKERREQEFREREARERIAVEQKRKEAEEKRLEGEHRRARDEADRREQEKQAKARIQPSAPVAAQHPIGAGRGHSSTGRPLPPPGISVTIGSSMSMNTTATTNQIASAAAQQVRPQPVGRGRGRATAVIPLAVTSAVTVKPGTPIMVGAGRGMSLSSNSGTGSLPRSISPQLHLTPSSSSPQPSISPSSATATLPSNSGSYRPLAPPPGVGPPGHLGQATGPRVPPPFTGGLGRGAPVLGSSATAGFNIPPQCPLPGTSPQLPSRLEGLYPQPVRGDVSKAPSSTPPPVIPTEVDRVPSPGIGQSSVLFCGGRMSALWGGSTDPFGTKPPIVTSIGSSKPLIPLSSNTAAICNMDQPPSVVTPPIGLGGPSMIAPIGTAPINNVIGAGTTATTATNKAVQRPAPIGAQRLNPTICFPSGLSPTDQINLDAPSTVWKSFSVSDDDEPFVGGSSALGGDIFEGVGSSTSNSNTSLRKWGATGVSGGNVVSSGTSRQVGAASGLIPPPCTFDSRIGLWDGAQSSHIWDREVTANTPQPSSSGAPSPISIPPSSSTPVPSTRGISNIGFTTYPNPGSNWTAAPVQHQQSPASNAQWNQQRYY